ncbi:hypothetical protein SAMN05421503_1274 [Terribacillus aidingensis]|uniref:Hook-length control protein FliK n=1 Tax=Terribacillus aidingensis TaxID=586416 RepID=A0A285NJZ5_9BACI|nr:hypothetical protein [Terribacillus aidingensis]SNZ09578.1 hypothetical protein SAMN05421503_1274 [Terribacillus aidingensis]
MYQHSIQATGKLMQAAQLQEKTLRSGEIVTGKINKFYPDNKALLQIGAKQVIAELQTQLSAGGTYWFEVKEGGERPLLQVLPPTAQRQSSVAGLIELTGNKVNSTASSFIEGLRKQQISFTIAELKQALQLLQQQEPHLMEVSKDALQVMLKRQLPLSANVLQAITARQTMDLTASIQQLAQDSPADGKVNLPLQNVLSKLAPGSATGNSAQLVQQIVQEVKSGKQDTYQAIRPFFPSNPPTYNTWQEEWLNFDTKTMRAMDTQSLQQVSMNSVSKDSKIPFPAALQSFMVELQQAAKPIAAVQSNAQTALSTAQQLLRMFPDQPLAQNVQASVSKALDAFNMVSTAQSLQEMLTNSNSKNEELLAKTADMLQLLQLAQRNEQSKDGAFFKVLLQDVMRVMGFSYEHDVAAADVTELPLKGLLLQHHAAGSEKAELSSQLLQQITGSQLLQVQDDKQMAYIQLQLPGAPFGLNKDMLLDIESRKEADGQLSAEHCRIMFYLDMPVLKELVVDMFVQKKAISLHIYTQSDATESVMRPLQNKLKAALETSGYHLSSVKYSLSGKANTAGQHAVAKPNVSFEQRGVDFRI